MKKNKEYDYSKRDIIKSLMKVGLKKGDNIFIHSNIGFFGKLKDANNKEEIYTIFKEAIFKVIEKDGTLVVPTFSYSYCWGKKFNKNETPSICGFLSEMVRTDSKSLRSEDANFSIAAIGKNAEYYTKKTSKYSFGLNSFWDKFHKTNGKICNFNFDSGSTFFHYVERVLSVPYRYDKPFFDPSAPKNKKEKKVFYHFVYDLKKPNHKPNFTKFDKKAKKLGLTKTANLGKGQIVLISTRDTYNLIKKELQNNPSFLIEGKLDI